MATGIAHSLACCVSLARRVRSVTRDRRVLIFCYSLLLRMALGSQRLHAVLKKGDYVELAQSKHYADIEITVLSVP